MAKPRSRRNRTPPANEDFIRFTSSVHYDHRLLRHDIAGSIAHAISLAEAGVVTEAESDKMIAGLRKVLADIESGVSVLNPGLEDVHMNVEHLLTEAIGGTGAKLHTGRSRNDQVALDMRLFVRESLLRTITQAFKLQETLLAKARRHVSSIMPGYTHMQHAQPILLSHDLLAHFWRIDRDLRRMCQCFDAVNFSPLGAGALAGSAFEVDRNGVARRLGMMGITENSLDSVSDRDFVAEAAFCLALLMIHLSSLCEELILWSSAEFGFARLPRRLSGGSSMMPQKANPDIAELVRGKSGRVVGDLVAILTLLKSLPLAYNRDLQEDKENLFDAFDTAEDSLHALRTLLADVEFNKVRMRKAAEVGLMTATDLADLLTTRGHAFREAHGLVKKLAVESDGNDGRFRELAARILREKSIAMELDFLSPEKAIARRSIAGGTAPEAVSEQMKKAGRAMSLTRLTLKRMARSIDKERKLLAG